jgi:hypothetical protein
MKSRNCRVQLGAHAASLRCQPGGDGATSNYYLRSRLVRCCCSLIMLLHTLLLDRTAAMPLLGSDRCGEYCSHQANLTGFIGAIDSADELRQAVRGVAYRNEMILSYHSSVRMMARWCWGGPCRCRR